MNVALILLLRAVFALGSVLIVGAGVLAAWAAGQPLLALAAFVAFPVTFFVYPFIGGLQIVLAVSLVAFWGANLLAAR